MNLPLRLVVSISSWGLNFEPHVPFVAATVGWIQICYIALVTIGYERRRHKDVLSLLTQNVWKNI